MKARARILTAVAAVALVAGSLTACQQTSACGAEVAPHAVSAQPALFGGGGRSGGFSGGFSGGSRSFGGSSRSFTYRAPSAPKPQRMAPAPKPVAPKSGTTVKQKSTTSNNTQIHNHYYGSTGGDNSFWMGLGLGWLFGQNNQGVCR